MTFCPFFCELLLDSDRTGCIGGFCIRTGPWIDGIGQIIVFQDWLWLLLDVLPTRMGLKNSMFLTGILPTVSESCWQAVLGPSSEDMI
jgi:hypothetical protein